MLAEERVQRGDRATEKYPWRCCVCMQQIHRCGIFPDDSPANKKPCVQSRTEGLRRQGGLSSTQGALWQHAYRRRCASLWSKRCKILASLFLVLLLSNFSLCASCALSARSVFFQMKMVGSATTMIRTYIHACTAVRVSVRVAAVRVRVRVGSSFSSL